MNDELISIFLILGAANIALMFLALGIWMHTLGAIIESQINRLMRFYGFLTAGTAIAICVTFIPLNLAWIWVIDTPEIGGLNAVLWKLFDLILGVFLISMGVWARLNIALLEHYFKDDRFPTDRQILPPSGE